MIKNHQATPFPNLKAVLFDLDGTLVDTDDMAVASLADRLRPLLGRRAPAIARYLIMKAETPGNAFITLLDILGLDEKTKALIGAAKRSQGFHPNYHFQLIDGVEELIVSLQERYRLALVTSRSREHIDHFLAAFPTIAAALETSCGSQDTARLKPHPAPVKLAAQRLGLPAEQCLMVGDTPLDIKAGRRAGAWSIGVLCGFGERRELERAGAHLILEETADLRQFI